MKKDAYEDFIAKLSKQFQLGLCFSVVVLLSVVSVAQANTITAASCSASDVQAAMNQASAGDTVAIAAGTCGWSTRVLWTAPANVTLMGAGDSSVGGGDRTVISDDYAANSPMLSLFTSNSGSFRMTGITFQSGTGTTKDGGTISLTGGTGGVRLDHLHFHFTSSANYKIIQINGGTYGVLDHSILDLSGLNALYFYAWGNDGWGDNYWTEDTNFGGSNFFFIEDNIINGTPSSHDSRVYDCMMSGRIVLRFNNITAACLGETHDTGSAGETRGCRAQENYGNYTTIGSGQTVPNATLSDVGNGVALVWGNSGATSFYQNVIKLFTTRPQPTETHYQSATPNGWGYCGTEYNGTGSNWDGNTDSMTGYPCLDQPGRGKCGDSISGGFPNRINDRTGRITWPNQALEPIYIWNNNVSPAAGWGGSRYANYFPSRIQANRDYYPQASGIQTSPTNPFNGTSGTGWGTLANRPTTCTAGVAYFAIDQGSWNTSSSNPYGVQQNGADGVLYKCTATNTWTLYYTPYTYPHPLTQGQSGLPPPTRVTAPTNLNLRLN